MKVVFKRILSRTTMRYHLNLSEWLLSKGEEKASVGEDVEKREPVCTVGGDVNWCSHYGNHMEGPQKLQLQPPCDPTIPLLGIYTQKIKY